MRDFLQLVHFFSWFRCPVCSLWKTRVQDLASHIKEEHPANEGLLLDCIECGKQFPLSTLLSHVQSCLKQKLPAWEAGKQVEFKRTPFSFARQKPMYYLIFSRNQETVVDINKRCKFCGSTYNSYKEFKEHLLSHSEAVRCKYDGCRYVTTEQRLLDR